MFAVYQPAAVPWPSDVARHQEWQEREDHRLALHLQAVWDAGEKEVLFFFKKRKKFKEFELENIKKSNQKIDCSAYQLNFGQKISFNSVQEFNSKSNFH